MLASGSSNAMSTLLSAGGGAAGGAHVVAEEAGPDSRGLPSAAPSACAGTACFLRGGSSSQVSPKSISVAERALARALRTGRCPPSVVPTGASGSAAGATCAGTSAAAASLPIEASAAAPTARDEAAAAAGEAR